MKLNLLKLPIITGALMLSLSTLAIADKANVEAVEVSKDANGYRFSVTVRHNDQGWDHYADLWDVVGKDGTVFGKRILAHPHDNEQPFTRSLSAVVIPDGVKEVIIRANDSVHGLGGLEKIVQLPN